MLDTLQTLAVVAGSRSGHIAAGVDPSEWIKAAPVAMFDLARLFVINGWGDVCTYLPWFPGCS